MKDPVVEQDIKEIVQSIKHLWPKLEGKTIVITGGSGFLGKYFLNTFGYLNQKVLKNPLKVYSLDNHITSGQDYMLFPHKKIQTITHDVKKKIKLNDDINYIIHAAGIASPVYYQKYPLETIDAAVNGTRNMLELAKKKRVESFLFFSSSEIYGNPTPDQIPTKETYNGNVSSIGPRSCYDESKRLGETLSMVYFNLFATPIKIVRPFNVFGPGMGYYDHRVIPTFIYKALTNEPIPVHDSGNQTRTFCYISDAIIGFLLVLLSGENGQAYNIGNDKNEINMNKLAQILKSVLKGKLIIRNIEYPAGYPADEPQRRCPDLSKVKKTVGYQSKVNLKEGLARSIKWCKANWF